MIESHWNVAMVQTSLAEALGSLGRWNEAAPLLESAGKRFDAVLKRLPDDPELKDHMEKHRVLLSRARQETTTSAKPTMMPGKMA